MEGDLVFVVEISELELKLGFGIEFWSHTKANHRPTLAN